MLTVHSSKAYEYIEEIYTEGIGNNPFEAKVKAIDEAMHRALVLASDKLLVADKNLYQVPIEELKNIFSISSIKGEESRAYLSGASYKAIMSFKYQQSLINNLINKYASDSTKDQFLEAIIIPLFKINRIYILNKDTKGWINAWTSASQKLLDYKLLTLDRDFYKEQNINASDILSLSYNELIAKVPNKLAKKIIIPIAEFFTDKTTGNSIIKIKYIIMSYSGEEEQSHTFQISDEKNGLTKTLNGIVDKFTEDFGVLRPKVDNQSSHAETYVSEVLKDRQTEPEKYITFYLQSSFEDEIKKIQAKLHKINEIKKFDISLFHEVGYRVRIYTNLDLYQLSEKFYYNGLSYYYNKDKKLVIINVVQ
ncbi:MAG: hypothetical protein SFT93_05405 [Rickettsiaceae bacterium]|nr:hypothetical protein [Rickettsiaceae bacterium]